VIIEAAANDLSPTRPIKAMRDGIAGVDYDSIFVAAPDGLRLHVRSYGPRLSAHLPVVCLPGLTRTAADFHDLAAAMAADPRTPRRVLALDYRGRGQSDYDRDPRNYNLATELSDVLAVLTALEVAPAVFIGTSRGGLLTMMLACARPTTIAAAVLNDIGPAIEPTGLVRIKNYVGKLPRPRSFEEGAEILRRLFGQHFPGLSNDDWLTYSHRSFKIDQRALAPTYDVRIAQTLEGVDFHQPPVPLWAQFDALARAPLMVLRGENSDILSAQTVATMQSRIPALEALTVPGQGHAPLLIEGHLIRRIAEFAAGCESVP
jgi:pimeloyl-ACP methyl ester carboxylesterase